MRIPLQRLPDFRMTQEFLSTMPGVRRVGVSSAPRAPSVAN
jgi:hypothetical protein